MWICVYLDLIYPLVLDTDFNIMSTQKNTGKCRWVYTHKILLEFCGARGKNTVKCRCFFNLYLHVYAAMHNAGKTPYRPPPDTPLILFHWGYF